jgi:hypothetical protein
MKLVLSLTILTLSLTAAASNCRITATVYDGFDCAGLTVKVQAQDDVHCSELTLSSVDNNFFDHLGRSERILAVRFKFKEGDRKVKEEFFFEDTEFLCLPIII